MENLANLLICAVGGFCVSYGVIVFILHVWCSRQISTRPADFHHGQNGNQRPIPRFGGLALAVPFAVLICLPLDGLFDCHTDGLRWVIAGLSLAMFGLGFLDDWSALGAKRKLAGQLAIASAAYFLGLGIHQFTIPTTDHIIELGIYGFPITVFWLVAMTNLINLIDGVDGLAGGISLMLMVLLAIVSNGADVATFIAIVMGGALLAFLCFNCPPAKIYLGDGGAYFLGFLIGELTISNSHKGTVVAALIAPMFVLTLPILDTSLALLRRGLSGLPLFRPDRRHLHHRLLQSGVTREDLALGAYLFTAFFLGLGLAAFYWRDQGIALLLGAATVALLLVASRFGFSKGWFNVGATLRRAMRARAEIQYALAHSRWLGMEGERGGSTRSICEDTALIARRLGFARLRIQLEDGEQAWQMTSCGNAGKCIPQPNGNEETMTFAGSDGCYCQVFRHQLPGHPACLIELQTPAEATTIPSQPATSGKREYPTSFQLAGELLSEAWAKSLADWHKRNLSPIAFNADSEVANDDAKAE